MIARAYIRMARAFWLLVAVSFVLLCVEAWQIHSTRGIASSAHELGKANSELIHQVAADHATIAQLQKSQADSCQNFETLKGAYNGLVTTISRLLRQGIATNEERAKNIRNPKLKAADRHAVAAEKKLLARSNAVTATCAQKQQHRRRAGPR